MVVNIITFLVMFILAAWTLFKYQNQTKDNFFVFSLCMYPFAYFLLAISTIFFLWAESKEDADYVHEFICNNILPFSYLVMWTIELLICFEMQLMRVKLTSDDPVQCQKRLNVWKTFRFFVLVVSTIFNLLKILVNSLLDFEDINSLEIHTEF